jgi:hypothetical protein
MARPHQGRGRRAQPVHAASGIPAPKVVNGVKQKPMDGVSFLPTFDAPNAPQAHRRQYFEIFSNRAIYDQGWMASAQHSFPWRQDYAPGNWDKDKWELYNLDEDFSQANDVAAAKPEKLAEMKALFSWLRSPCSLSSDPLDVRQLPRLLEQRPVFCRGPCYSYMAPKMFHVKRFGTKRPRNRTNDRRSPPKTTE